MDLDEFVKQSLENATVEQLIDVARNSVDIPDDEDMREALQNAYVEHAKEKLRLLNIQFEEV